jgi:hypothetical protein
MRHLLPMFAGMLALLPASATTLEKLSLDDMIAKSTAVVRGRVQGCTAEFRAPIIYTHCKVAISEHWKGNTPAIADVMILGGTFKGTTQSFPGAPKLTEGEEYVLFLWTGRSGMTQIIGFSQGAFSLSMFAKSEQVEQKSAAGETLLDPMGRRVSDDPIRMSLKTFKARVLSGVAQKDTQ